MFRLKARNRRSSPQVDDAVNTQPLIDTPQNTPDVYDQDGLRSVHNHEFMNNPKFKEAYGRGMQASGIDYQWHWRVHVYLWAFSQCLKHEGDIVECGVYKGFMLSASMKYTNWNKQGRSAYLFDTFKGIDESQLNKEERKIGRDTEFRAVYTEVYDDVKKNFQEFKGIHLIRGSVPGSLSKAKVSKVAFLALDMNNTKPEVEALKHFWPLMSSGAMCLMDDYAYVGYRPQKKALDSVAKGFGVEILSMPTGQGLLIKP